MAFFSQFIVENLVFESEIWKTLTFFTYPDKQNHYFNIALITFTSILCPFIWGHEQIRNAHNMLNYRSTIFWLGSLLPEKALTSNDQSLVGTVNPPRVETRLIFLKSWHIANRMPFYYNIAVKWLGSELHLGKVIVGLLPIQFHSFTYNTYAYNAFQGLCSMDLKPGERTIKI